LTEGDLLITKDGTIGKLAIVKNLDKPACLNSGIFVVRSREVDFSTEFLYWVLKSKSFTQFNGYTSYGSTIQHLYQNVFVEFAFPCPKPAEQTAIAAYLDRKTAEIDDLITKKEHLLRLYEEEKTALINQAVTKGLNPHVPMKDSGIDWLGEIPAHWEVKKLKYLVKNKLKYGANESALFENIEDPRYIRITDFGNDGRLRDNTFKSLPYETAKDYMLDQGDILFARSGATVGKTFQFKDYKGKACFAGYLIKASPKKDILKSDFIYLYTKSSLYERWKESIFNQATIQNIGADKYAFLDIPIPKLAEQIAIVQYIEKEIASIDAKVTKTKKLIELLKEYKTALISEVVTGKVKVI
jgi:restriction endonuclease S subunit